MSQMVLAWQGMSTGGDVGCASHLWLSAQYLPSRNPLRAPALELAMLGLCETGTSGVQASSYSKLCRTMVISEPYHQC